MTGTFTEGYTEGYEAVLTIRGLQVYADGTPDSSELMTQGWLRPVEGGWEVAYEETEVTGMEGTTTCLAFLGDHVLLSRTGTVTAQMLFQPGRQHSTLYETPFGPLTMDIHTHQLRGGLDERGGTLEIRYSISIQNQLNSRNLFRIRVRRTNQR